MGKMILDDLRKRLERLDEDADLMIDNSGSIADLHVKLGSIENV